MGAVGILNPQDSGHTQYVRKFCTCIAVSQLSHRPAAPAACISPRGGPRAPGSFAVGHMARVLQRRVPRSLARERDQLRQFF
jgi:hypothetical protein